jgi:putative DNA primase/helicase
VTENLSDPSVLARATRDAQVCLVGEQHHGQVRMAYRLAARYGDRLMHVFGLGWFAWDGCRWAEDQHGAAKQAVLDVLRAASAESIGAPGGKALRRDVQLCDSAAGVAGVLSIAAALPPFARTVTDLDADEYLVNAANGTLDLRSMQLRRHDPADRITKITRAACRPDECDGARWDGFLARVLPDEPVRGFLQRVCGLALVGRAVEHVLPILTGTGANGKTTFYGAVCHAFGDYAIVGEPDLFLRRDGTHPTGEMDLRGRRFVVVSESDKDRRLAEATVKRLTGGDPIRARRMHRDFVQFDPSHTPVLITNHLPKVRGDDPAVWRRLKVVPFTTVIPDAEQDRHLEERLRLDADAVLAWALAGYQAYVTAGLDEPDAVTAATSRYREESDAVTRFIAECCLTGEHYFVPVRDLYDAWCKWAAGEHVDPMSKTAFGLALDRLGYPADRTMHARLRRGLALYAEEDGDDTR